MLFMDPNLPASEGIPECCLRVFLASEETYSGKESFARSEDSCFVKWQFQKVPKRLLMTRSGVSFLFAS